MSKMTVIWLVIYLGAALSSFVNPVYGLMGYLFEYYLRPSLHWWGAPLPDLRWSMTISIIVFASYLLKQQTLPTLRQLRNPALPWLLGLVFVMIIITPMAASWERSYDKMVIFLKIVAIYLFIASIIRTRRGFDALIGMHMAGAAWWGWEAYHNPRREASRLLMVGSGDTLDDNQAAAHLLTVLPFILVYLLTAKDKRVRAVAIVAAPFVINLMILCNSRGATIGLAVGMVAAFCLAKRGHRLRLIGVAALTAVGFLALADPEFIARQKTTTDYENQVTATQRLESWRGGWNLVKDHPFGAGGEADEILSPIYWAEIVERNGGAGRAVHNTYVLILAEWGFEGMFLFLGFVGATFLMLHRVRKRSNGDDMFYRAFAVQVALLSTMAASTFVDRFYGESFYWLCAMAVALYRMPDEVAQPASDEVVKAAAAARPVWGTPAYAGARAFPR